MTTAARTVDIPTELLERLKKKNKRSAALSCVKDILTQNKAIPGGESGWNSMINWLEAHYPGWRGYTIEYPCGWVG